MKNGWTLYRLSCYLLLLGSILSLGWMGYVSYTDYQGGGPQISFGLAFLIFVPIGWFQGLNIAFLEEKIIGDNLLKKLDSWAYYLLLRWGFLVSLLFVALDTMFVFQLIQQWRFLGHSVGVFLSLSAFIAFPGLLIYNLVGAIRFKRFLIKHEKEFQQSFIDSIGS